MIIYTAMREAINRTVQKQREKRGWLSEHFHSGEFVCHCGCGRGKPTQELVDMLERFRKACGDKPIRITSGYRCPEHNRDVGGVSRSQHTSELSHPPSTGITWAADIQVEGVPPSQVYALACTRFDGVGKYRTFTHVDVRGKKARWGR